MVGKQTDTYTLTEHDGKRLFVAIGVGIWHHGAQHQYIKQVLLHILFNTLHHSLGCLIRLIGGLSEIYLHLLVEGSQQVHTPVLGLGSVVNNAILGFYLHSLTMKGCGFRRTIDDRCTHIQHHGVFESTKYHLITNAVGVAMRDGHANFLIHRYI